MLGFGVHSTVLIYYRLIKRLRRILRKSNFSIEFRIISFVFLTVNILWVCPNCCSLAACGYCLVILYYIFIYGMTFCGCKYDNSSIVSNRYDLYF